MEVGRKDITAHVNFTAMAGRAGGGPEWVLGTTQAHFLINCGLLSKWSIYASPAGDSGQIDHGTRDGRAVQGAGPGRGRAVGARGQPRRPVAPALTAQAAHVRWLIVILPRADVHQRPVAAAAAWAGPPAGDFRFKVFGRDWFIAWQSTVLLSFVVSLIAKWL